MNSKISALMDGELFEDETDILFDQLKQDNDSQSDWVLYHLIGDVLRQPEYIHRDVSNVVAEKMLEEPTIFAPRTHALKQKVRVFALSAAASVLAVSVVAWMSVQISPEGAPAQMAIQASAMHAASWQIQPQSNDYLNAHQEYSTSTDISSAAYHPRVDRQDGKCQ
ncbi:MAG: sigma-E factor negative regulatory protein [Gallionella sp.]|nr:sigma-E factor negative regulatory protein [Gallionella sp.]MDD4958500.1 sigma-E factor negative regulatory protein [Gallionella sp.]